MNPYTKIYTKDELRKMFWWNVLLSFIFLALIGMPITSGPFKIFIGLALTTMWVVYGFLRKYNVSANNEK